MQIHKKSTVVRTALLLIIMLFFMVQAIHAQTPPASTAQSSIQLDNPINATSVPELVNNIVRTILGMVGALALMMFVYGGMLWMTSMGNQQRIEKGKETLIWATIGLAIIFASYGILNFIFTALSGRG